MINNRKKETPPLKIKHDIYRSRFFQEMNKACFGELVPHEHEWYNRAFRNFIVSLNRSYELNRLIINKFKSFRIR